MCKIKTEINGFDQITNGGIPLSKCIGLICHYNIGRKVLMWLTWQFLMKKFNVLYICLNHSIDELTDNFTDHDLKVKQFISNQQLTILDVFSASVNKLLTLKKSNRIDEEMFDKYHTSMFDVNSISKPIEAFLSHNKLKGLCIIDSLSPLLLTKTNGAFQMIDNIKRLISVNQAIGVTMIHSGIHSSTIEEKFKAHFEIIMSIQKTSGNSHFIKLNKYPGICQQGPFPLEVGTQNLSIIPVEMPELDEN
jgi:KaiC/GvpD/RAD55 family RecA-like ATPase